MTDLKTLVAEGERYLSFKEASSPAIQRHYHRLLGVWLEENATTLLAAARECAEAREQRDAMAAALSATTGGKEARDARSTTD